jgi:hypothetical protein
MRFDANGDYLLTPLTADDPATDLVLSVDFGMASRNILSLRRNRR